MEDNNTLPLKRFSSKAMLSNIGVVKSIIQRIRQQEGGIGSLEDELSLHRMIQDLDLLVDVADGLKASNDELQDKLNTTAASLATAQRTTQSLKDTYEKMIQDRNDRIVEMKEQLKKLDSDTE